MATLDHKKSLPITCLFVDVGGVLLTNGWDHKERKRAAHHFNLDWVDMQKRHALNFESQEEDKITFKQYLDRVVFWKRQPFTRAAFRAFMFSQSEALPNMLELVQGLKTKYHLKVFVVSNEAREVNAYRIPKFQLNSFVDAFVCSCFVSLRKPDAAIFRLAVELAQVPVRQIVYIENTALFVQVAESFGIRTILHTDFLTTLQKLGKLGLEYKD